MEKNQLFGQERKHLTELEMEKLLKATKGARYEARDRCFILLAFRHGLRVSEACRLSTSQVDMESRVLHVVRLKKGLNTTHPLRPDELRAVKAWLAVRRKMKPDNDAFFISARRTPLSRNMAWVMVRGYGEKAGLALKVSPHMLRHGCGYALADQGADTRLIQDYMGHRRIQNTVRYTATNPRRFQLFWR